MCGIVAYLGKREVIPVLIEGLQRLEYRGYDSAGISILEKDGLKTFKKQGKVSLEYYKPFIQFQEQIIEEFLAQVMVWNKNRFLNAAKLVGLNFQ